MTWPSPELINSMKIDAFSLQRVRFMPDSLVPGILYVSEEFGTAAHLCACGCGAKIRTPLGPTEWAFEDTKTGPSLSPSIGNWQQACQSHYVITGGKVEWATKWSPEQIIAGRQHEEKRRRLYYDTLYPSGIWQRFLRWIKSFFKWR
jgi:hypothetical protein